MGVGGGGAGGGGYPVAQRGTGCASVRNIYLE